MVWIMIVCKKTNQKNSKTKNGRATFWYVTHHLNLIHIAIKFRQGIPYGYLLMVRTRSVKLYSKGSNSEIKKRESNYFCMLLIVLTSYV